MVVNSLDFCREVTERRRNLAHGSRAGGAPFVPSGIGLVQRSLTTTTRSAGFAFESVTTSLRRTVRELALTCRVVVIVPVAGPVLMMRLLPGALSVAVVALSVVYRIVNVYRPLPVDRAVADVIDS